MVAVAAASPVVELLRPPAEPPQVARLVTHTQARYCAAMDAVLQQYVDTAAAPHRELFERLHQLVVEAVPEASVAMSYGIPTYKVGRRRLFLGVWQHGVSIYGWGAGRDAGFVERHPELRSGKGTIRLRAGDAAAIPDQEFADLVRAVLIG